MPRAREPPSETDSPFTAAALAEESPVKDRPLGAAGGQWLRLGASPAGHHHPGLRGRVRPDTSVEETAAATRVDAGPGRPGGPRGAHHRGRPGHRRRGKGAHGAAGLCSLGLAGAVGRRSLRRWWSWAAQWKWAWRGRALSPSGAVIQQVTKQEILDLDEAGVTPPRRGLGLGRLLCAVTELGGGGPAAAEEKGRAGARDVLVQLPGQEAATPAAPRSMCFTTGRGGRCGAGGGARPSWCGRPP